MYYTTLAIPLSITHTANIAMHEKLSTS